jgi:hypothetical protein
VGAHDDQVTAVGLAVQTEPPPPFNAAVGGERVAITEMERQPALSPHVQRQPQPDRILPDWNPSGLRPGERIRPPGQGSRYVSG